MSLPVVAPLAANANPEVAQLATFFNETLAQRPLYPTKFQAKNGAVRPLGFQHHQKPSRPVKQYFAAKITTLLQQAPFVRHLSRQKFVGPFIIGLGRVLEV